MRHLIVLFAFLIFPTTIISGEGERYYYKYKDKQLLDKSDTRVCVQLVKGANIQSITSSLTGAGIRSETKNEVGRDLYVFSVQQNATLDAVLRRLRDIHEVAAVHPVYSFMGTEYEVYLTDSIISNHRSHNLMVVRSNYPDVSSGELLELETQTLNLRLLRDSTYNISSATYLPNENRCIYYSYGEPSRQILPGYYILDLSTLQDSLLFQYISEIGPAEVVNGFDISPNGEKLLFPINRAAEPPLIVEYALATGIRETLNVSFERQLLWLRYHPSGGQVVYSNYPCGAGGFTVGTDSEIGVIEIATLSKRILDVNTSPGWMSVSVFPNWSPDGKHIVYGSAPGPVVSHREQEGFTRCISYVM